MDNELNQAGAAQATGTEPQDENNGRFYSDDEIELIKQKAGDLRISQYQKTLERKQREADRLRSMNADDRRSYELDERERAIAARESELALLANKSDGLSILAEKGLDSKLIDIILDESAEVMYGKIKVLEKAFKQSVKAEVDKRLAGQPPVAAHETGPITKADFAKMTLAEQARLYAEDRELYNSLIK